MSKWRVELDLNDFTLNLETLAFRGLSESISGGCLEDIYSLQFDSTSGNRVLAVFDIYFVSTYNSQFIACVSRSDP